MQKEENQVQAEQGKEIGVIVAPMMTAKEEDDTTAPVVARVPGGKEAEVAQVRPAVTAVAARAVGEIQGNEGEVGAAVGAEVEVEI